MDKNYYHILNISPLAEAKTIKSAYRTLMFKCRCHPDLGGSEEIARRINEAYDVLSNPSKRKKYDLGLGREFFRFAREQPERRRVPRVSVNFTASYSGKSSRFEPARILDLSSIGCRIQTTEKLEKGENITINIFGHLVKGAVRWQRMFHPSLFQRIHEAGIEFAQEFVEIETLSLR